MMKMRTFYTHRMVKGEDLNHHGTLFAGRSAEWFVEAGFIAASHLIPPANILCLQIHGMLFTRPVPLGAIVCYHSSVVYTGRSRMVTYIKVTLEQEFILDGFITFVAVDDAGKSRPHGIVIEAETPEEEALQARALSLNENKR